MVIVFLLIYSWFQFPTQEKQLLKKDCVFHLSEKVDNHDGLPLRSITEEIPEIEDTSISLDYHSVELFYATITRVKLVQKRTENSYFKSQSKRYLKLLRLLI